MDDLIQLQDAVRTVEFQGQRIARTSTEKRDLVRWTEIELYRLTDGTGRYVFRVIGRSLVYHKTAEQGGCGKGSVRPAAELAGWDAEPGDYDAQPCAACRPKDLDHLGADEPVQAERDWYRVEVCRDPQDVYLKLAEHNPKGRSESAGGRPTLNHPSQRLLEAAGEIDPAFRADQVVDRL